MKMFYTKSESKYYFILQEKGRKSAVTNSFYVWIFPIEKQYIRT